MPSIQKIIPLYYIIIGDLDTHINDCETGFLSEDSENSIEDQAIIILKKNLYNEIETHIKHEFRPEFEIASFLDPGYRYMIDKDMIEPIRKFLEKKGLIDEIDVVILIFLQNLQFY